MRRHLAEYYGMITHLDHEIGRVIDKLKEIGELENTLIVFTGDNGLALGCHGLMGKQNLYDHSVRIPLVLRGPGIPAGESRDQFVYLLDLFPTLCELNDLEVPDSVEGISFAPILADPSAETRSSLYFAYNELIRSVKDKRYKLIEYRTTVHKTQLFDLQEDPDELHDLSDLPEYEETLHCLRNLLFAYCDTWEAEHPYSQAFWSNF